MSNSRLGLVTNSSLDELLWSLYKFSFVKELQFLNQHFHTQKNIAWECF